MNAELTQKLHEKYPAIFATHCGLYIGDGWYGIIDAMCEAMTDAYTTTICVDDTLAKALGIEPDPHENPDGRPKPPKPRYTLHVECPQIVALQVKEKHATLRFNYRLEFEPRFHELAFGKTRMPEANRIADRYHSYMDGIVQMAEILSARTCEETGKAGELHVSNAGRNEWYRTLNREFAQTDPNCRSLNYVPAVMENP